jgi:hypothetical protein
MLQYVTDYYWRFLTNQKSWIFSSSSTAEVSHLSRSRSTLKRQKQFRKNICARRKKTWGICLLAVYCRKQCHLLSLYNRNCRFLFLWSETSKAFCVCSLTSWKLRYVENAIEVSEVFIYQPTWHFIPLCVNLQHHRWHNLMCYPSV